MDGYFTSKLSFQLKYNRKLNLTGAASN